jgi:hypothetical protein
MRDTLLTLERDTSHNANVTTRKTLTLIGYYGAAYEKGEEQTYPSRK